MEIGNVKGWGSSRVEINMLGKETLWVKYYRHSYARNLRLKKKKSEKCESIDIGLQALAHTNRGVLGKFHIISSNLA